MIARLFISSSLDHLKKEFAQTLALHLRGIKSNSTNQVRLGVKLNHPDILYFEAGEKLGIAQARKIKEHFSLRPFSFKSKAAVLEDASLLTTEAQNALLKTIEELPKEAILLLGASSNANFLLTILSRCEITFLEKTQTALDEKTLKNIETLLSSSLEERFAYVEKLKDKESFLQALVYFFREQLIKDDTHNAHARPGLASLVNELLQAEKWAKQNVSIRAILEYLMMKMPRLESRV